MILGFKDEQKRAEKFNKEIPENLDNAWKRCRKVIKMTRWILKIQNTTPLLKYGKNYRNSGIIKDSLS